MVLVTLSIHCSPTQYTVRPQYTFTLYIAPSFSSPYTAWYYSHPHHALLTLCIHCSTLSIHSSPSQYTLHPLNSVRCSILLKSIHCVVSGHPFHAYTVHPLSTLFTLSVHCSPSQYTVHPIAPSSIPYTAWYWSPSPYTVTNSVHCSPSH
jgi:hypothetical protein